MKLSLFLAAVSIVSSSSPLLNAGNIDNPTASSIYTTNVLDDLNQDADFSTANQVGDFRFLNFFEFGYSPVFDKYFDLISYFYINPELINDGTYSTSSLYAQISLNYGEYTKLDLKVLSSDSGYYKCSLVNKYSLYQTSLKSRTYSFSGLSLYKKPSAGSSDSIHEFTVGNKYTYTGYAVSMNGNAESSLACSKEELNTINLQVKTGTWMTESYGGSRTCIYYSMFNLPNTVLNTYGYLYQIHYSYDLVQLNTMLALCKDYSVSTTDFFSNHSSFGVVDEKTVSYSDDDDFSWPALSIDDIATHPECVFSINASSDSVQSTELEERYASLSGNDFQYLKKKSFDIVTSNIDHPIEIRDNDLNAFEKWWESWANGISYTDKKYEDAPTWSTVTSSSFFGKTNSELSDSLYISSSDADYIKTKLLNADEKTYIFRYENRNYYAEKVRGCPRGALISLSSDCGYYFNSYATVNFDIISFSFEKDGVVTIIPVIMDPVSNFPTAVSPNTPTKNWFLIIMAVLALIVLVILVGMFFFKVFPTLKLSKSINSFNKSKRRK